MTNNLNLSQVVPGQYNVVTAINDQSAELDAALTDYHPFTISTSNTHTLTADEFRRHQSFKPSDDASAPTATCTLNCPAVMRGVFVVDNNLSQALNVQISGQGPTAPQIASGAVGIFYCDGSSVRAV